LSAYKLGTPLARVTWKPEFLLSDSPIWMLDTISWVMAFSLVTLALAVILTDVAREFEVEASNWAGSLALTSLGLIAVFAGNSTSLLFGWAALDIAELTFLLRHLHSANERRQALIVFSARVGGIFLLLLGQDLAITRGVQFRFDQIPPQVGIYLLLAVSLRLGVVPLHVPFWREPPLRRGIGTISRLAPVAASLVFLARVASVGIQPILAPGLLFLSGLTALYAGFSWFNAENELNGRPFWILGMAALAISSAVRGFALASLAWSMGLIFTGCFIFLFSARNRFLIPLAYISAFCISLLPFTPSWEGGHLYASPLTIWHIFFLLAHSLLLAGFVRFSRMPGEELTGVGRWVWVIYPLGLVFILVSYLLSGWVVGSLFPSEGWGIGLGTIFPGVLLIALVVVWLIWRVRIPSLPDRVSLGFRNVFSLRWFYTFLGWLFNVTSRVIYFITMVLEGEGGVLWALLLLTLLLAFVTRGGLGGG
jgi:hypothetical protein